MFKLDKLDDDDNIYALTINEYVEQTFFVLNSSENKNVDSTLIHIYNIISERNFKINNDYQFFLYTIYNNEDRNLFNLQSYLIFNDNFHCLYIVDTIRNNIEIWYLYFTKKEDYKLLNKVINIFKNFSILNTWCYIDITDKNESNIIDYYNFLQLCNFKEPNITNRSYFNKILGNKVIIELINHNNEPIINLNYENNIFRYYVDKYFRDNIILGEFKFSNHLESIKNIDDFIFTENSPQLDKLRSELLSMKSFNFIDLYYELVFNQNIETSGGFNISSVSSYSNILLVNLNKLIKFQSNNDPGFTSVVNAFITFHTHHVDIMKKENCNFAWPSSQDFIIYLNNTLNILHFVFSNEGIYIIKNNPQYIEIIYDIYYNYDNDLAVKLDDYLKRILKILLVKLENERKAEYDPYLIKTWLYYINSLKLINFTPNLFSYDIYYKQSDKLELLTYLEKARNENSPNTDLQSLLNELLYIYDNTNSDLVKKFFNIKLFKCDFFSLDDILNMNIENFSIHTLFSTSYLYNDI